MAGPQTVDGRDLSADGSKLDTLATVGTTSITTLGTIGTGVWQGTAIASTYIAGDAITGTKIADNAIDSEHYTDGSIDTEHIADNVVDEANLKVSNSPTNGYFLSAQSGNAGGLTWAEVIGGATNGLFYENDQAVASSYTIVSAKNAMTTGPIRINNNVTVRFENGGRWVVI